MRSNHLISMAIYLLGNSTNDNILIDFSFDDITILAGSCHEVVAYFKETKVYIAQTTDTEHMF